MDLEEQQQQYCVAPFVDKASPLPTPGHQRRPHHYPAAAIPISPPPSTPPPTTTTAQQQQQWWWKELCHTVLSRSLNGFSSLGMIFVNKSLATSYHLVTDKDLSVALIVLQATVVLVCLETCRYFKVIPGVQYWYPTTTTTTSTATLPTKRILYYSTTTAQQQTQQWIQFTVAGGLLGVMLWTNMLSLQRNSISMVIVSRNVANLFVLLGDYVIFHNCPDGIAVSLSTLLMLGAIYTAQHHGTLYSTTTIGYEWMILNCISTTGYILFVKQISTTTSTTTNTTTTTSPLAPKVALVPGAPMTIPASSSSSLTTSRLSLFGMIFVNNVLCITFLLPLAYHMGELSLFVQTTTTSITECNLIVKNLLAGLACFVFNFAVIGNVWHHHHHPQQHHHHYYYHNHHSTMILPPPTSSGSNISVFSDEDSGGASIASTGSSRTSAVKTYCGVVVDQKQQQHNHRDKRRSIHHL